MALITNITTPSSAPVAGDVKAYTLPGKVHQVEITAYTDRGLVPRSTIKMSLFEAKALVDSLTAVIATIEIRTENCSKCGNEIEMQNGIGWVDTVSGDDGGTYDVCTEGGKHTVNRLHRSPF